jgi:hypothetical protein
MLPGGERGHLPSSLSTQVIESVMFLPVAIFIIINTIAAAFILIITTIINP